MEFAAFSNGIGIRQYDVEIDQRAAARMRKIGDTQGVPFAVINGKKLAVFL